MIVLDTHIWVWWVQGDPRLTKRHCEEIDKSQKQGIGICSISCLEVARLVERGRIGLPDNDAIVKGMALEPQERPQSVWEFIELLSITNLVLEADLQ